MTHDPIRDDFLLHEVDWYKDRVLDDAPKLPANELCNARRTYKVGKSSLLKGYCNLTAGHGTEHLGEGRCKFHDAPKSAKEGPKPKSTGAPKGNQNASTHSLTADPSRYHENLPDEEREFVLDVSAAIEDRIRSNKGDVDYLDRVLARRVAIKLHIVASASEYISVNALTQTIFTEDGSYDADGPLVSELRQYDKTIISELKTLGLLDDPETRKADAMSDWRAFLDPEKQ